MLPIYFAPLQGYTEDAYRRLHHQLIGGVEEYFTPFLRLEHGEVRGKDVRDMKPEHNTGVPVTPQLIANGAEEMKRLLDVVIPLGYKQIDINMGCPFPLQTRHGRGAGVLSHPEKVKEMAEIINEYKDIAFSVKMRLGIDDKEDWRSVLPILNDTPLRHITLHPRIARQQYKGEVDKEAFKAFLGECRHPVIYNGDIQTMDDIEQMEKTFPQLACVMIGRGLLARPTLAREYMEGAEWSHEKQMAAIRRLHDSLLAHYAKVIPGEQQQMLKLRTFWDYMEPTIGHKAWKKIMKAGNMKNYLKAVEEV